MNIGIFFLFRNMSIEERKNAEGFEHLAKADKYLETSYLKLKFNPDWDSAADELNKAAVCFKVARNWKSCKEAHLRACEGYANSGSLYHAGKQLEQALFISKEQNDLSQVEELAGRGGLLYRQAGSPEAAAQLLVKAAKLLEPSSPENAIGLYQKASETVGTEDRTIEAAQHMETACKLMVRVKQYDRAADALDKTLQLYSEGGVAAAAGRVVLAFILVQLQRGDSVAANKVYNSWGAFMDSQQAAAAKDITQGFSDLDRELAQAGLGSAVVRSLDNDYVKLARDIQLPAQANDDEELDLC
ncbi:gamma-soluble NSF attachment protein [Eurytemora carolleeae]|uniref:gamma-soluble NSF attachment protein n=1 Tax=Eurytemora carolleeae TaxID=1294199 RepID=UPI000C75DA40|nr:gamma-soluble NSF attachment protein [Eurytemora carolleeae]|eukprot:XP_023338769.1 gamma-soluble NSF attachment protein-like [Eurytemora affinis]